jgi:hypothetical protein
MVGLSHLELDPLNERLASRKDAKGAKICKRLMTFLETAGGPGPDNDDYSGFLSVLGAFA